MPSSIQLSPNPPLPPAEMFDRADCIWKQARVREYNCHLLLRTVFELPSEWSEAELRIVTSDHYRLYLNREWVGDGPARSDRGVAYVDGYSGERLPLRFGLNVVAIEALNKHLDEHGQPAKEGGMFFCLTIRMKDGGRVEVRSGPDWKVASAERFIKPAPRRFFPVGFNEWVDFRNDVPDWKELDYCDSDWELAEVVDHSHLAECYSRPVPLFRRKWFSLSRALRAGHLGSLEGCLGVPFAICGNAFSPGGAIFRTWVYSAEACSGVFVDFGCDSRATVSFNGDRIWHQGASDHGFRMHLSAYEDLEYRGMIHGHGLRFQLSEAMKTQTRCSLNAGWNLLEVAVDFPEFTYGFELALCDFETDRPLPLVCSATSEVSDCHSWQWRSQGAPGGSWETIEWREQCGPPHNWLEPSHLQSWDQPVMNVSVEGLTAFADRRSGDDELVLDPGSLVEFELEDYGVGYLELKIEGPAGSLVEVAISERIDAEGALTPINNGLWQVDRLILSGRKDHWVSLERRAGRYVSIAVRSASGPVKVYQFGLAGIEYDYARSGHFECEDPVLNWMWRVGFRTTVLATTDLSEDCPTREMAQWSGDAFIRTHLLACMWGDLTLSEKSIREFASDQAPDRWGRAMAPAGYGDSLSDYALLLPIWIRNHYQLSGDLGLVADVWQGVENLFVHAASLEDSRGFLIPVDRDRNQIYLDFAIVRPVRHLPMVTGLQAYYLRSLESAAFLARLIGKEAQADCWTEKAGRLRERIDQLLWSEDQELFVNGEDADGRLSVDVGAVTNYLILWANGTSAGRESKILQKLFSCPDRENLDMWVNGEGVYMKYFASEVLLERGMCREALTAWRGFYGSMMSQNLTIPETWDRAWEEELPEGTGDTPSPDNTISTPAIKSLVHPFGIGPMWHLMYYICGIQPMESGYGCVRWRPNPGDLQRIEARFPIIGREGDFEVILTVGETGHRHLTLKVPSEIEVIPDREYLEDEDQLDVVHAQSDVI